jgi:Flp pilus assembly protein TadG
VTIFAGRPRRKLLAAPYGSGVFLLSGRIAAGHEGFLRRLALRTGERDRGSISMFTVIFTVSVILLAGLLVDGGLAIHARQRAYDIAEQAARAGADDINEANLRATGNTEINVDTACGKVDKLLAAYPGEIDQQATICDRTPQEVTVTIQITVQPQLLSIVPGFSAFTMTGTASAHPDEGNP